MQAEKAQWSITSQQSEWQSLKGLHIINVGEGVEKMEPFYTVGGSINQHSHYEEQYGCPEKTLKTGSGEFS